MIVGKSCVHLAAIGHWYLIDTFISIVFGFFNLASTDETDDTIIIYHNIYAYFICA